jgi:hypothetical protein
MLSNRMGKEQSPYEGLIDNLGGRICLGQVISVDAANRLCRVKTMGNKNHGTDDQDLQNVKFMHFAWNSDGTYGVAIPEINSYCIVGFVNSEPIILGAYPLSNVFGGGIPANQIDGLLPGDYALVTAMGSKMIVRSGGTVELYSTPNCRTFWQPIYDTITTVCQNSEMAVGGGYQNFTVDPTTSNVLYDTKVYDNLEVENAVQLQMGTTAAGGLVSLAVGPVDDDLNITTPVMTAQVGADGTTTLNVGAGNITITITPAGALTIQAKGDATINTTGNVNVMAGGNATVTASGTTTLKGSEVVFNQQISGVTTYNSHYGVVDFITGIPVMPSTTVFADI